MCVFGDLVIKGMSECLRKNLEFGFVDWSLFLKYYYFLKMCDFVIKDKVILIISEVLYDVKLLFSVLIELKIILFINDFELK